ncbi:prepilin-type N-terminal cleavage/methylation domain-containing protein [Lentisphaera araneosa]|nr:prepilin-type N-terminal cleavage/methylation domain-containing protein [Lentisphaera araneosa]
MMKKFSLIELLVVVAIIGILGSLLLPTLGKARKKSKQAVCLSNMKQIGSAEFMYQDDNDQYHLVRDNEVYTQYNGWQFLLAPYVNNDGTTAQEVQSSGVFACPSSQLNFNNEWQNGGIGYNTNMGSIQKSIQIAVNAVEVPVETILTADGDEAGGAVHLDNQIFQPGSPHGEPGARHNGGVNTLLADGHAQWYSKVQLMAGKNGNQDYYYMPTK